MAHLDRLKSIVFGELLAAEVVPHWSLFNEGIVALTLLASLTRTATCFT
jgi:hypothetical protein